MRLSVLNFTAQGRRKPVTYVTNQDDENAESPKTKRGCGPLSLAGQWPRSLRSGQESSTPSFGSQSGHRSIRSSAVMQGIGLDQGKDASRRIRHRCGRARYPQHRESPQYFGPQPSGLIGIKHHQHHRIILLRPVLDSVAASGCHAASFFAQL
jgi:hypothetical protein